MPDELATGKTAIGIASDTAVGHVQHDPDRKSTRLNSSHSQISYAVFCLKKKNEDHCGVASGPDFSTARTLRVVIVGGEAHSYGVEATLVQTGYKFPEFPTRLVYS